MDGISSADPGGRVLVDAAGAVATITLARPAMNVIDDRMLQDLGEALDVVARAGCSVLRIRSSQRVFCAGADLEMVAGRLESPDGAAAMVETIRLFHRVYDQLALLPVVTVAEIDGHALGGGLELALACDIRVASTRSKLGLPEAKLGLLPGAGGTQRLTELCGRGVAARLILAAELVSATEAERLGLVQFAVEPEQLPLVVEEVIARAAALSPAALRAAKTCIGIAGRIKAEGVLAEIDGIGALMRDPSTVRRVREFLRKS